MNFLHKKCVCPITLSLFIWKYILYLYSFMLLYNLPTMEWKIQDFFHFRHLPIIKGKRVIVAHIRMYMYMYMRNIYFLKVEKKYIWRIMKVIYKKQSKTKCETLLSFIFHYFITSISS